MTVLPERSRVGATDGLLLLVVTLWGSNFSVVKVAIEEIPPLAFNGLRLVLASMVLVGAARLADATMPRRSDWLRLVALGLVGHCGYQFTFVLGLARTSVTNSSLILGCLPVTVLLLNAVSRRREAVARRQWLGVALAFVGLYLVVGDGTALTLETIRGDLLVIGSVWCWGWYTIGSRPLLSRYTPLALTACTTVVGTVSFLLFAMRSLLALEWRAVSGWAWVGTAASGLLALSLSYVLWYRGVQQLGSARTALYSNLVPVVAMVVAAVGLREPIGVIKLLGAGLVLSALALTRMVTEGAVSVPLAPASVPVRAARL
ncbi:MAG: DMT family transporter [Acidobacteriota bacterium]|nr:DMT family transporter [Acidobacteriota bacterium]